MAKGIIVEEIKSKIIATVKNVVKDGNALVLFASFTDGEEKSYKFDPETPEEKIIATVKEDVDFKNSVESKVDTIAKSLIGMEIS